MTVYVDVLVTLNIFVNYFLLLCVKGIMKADSKRLRLFFGAFLGGLYSLTIFIDGAPDYIILLMNLAASAVIVLVTFGVKSLKSFLKFFAAFFGVNFSFAGLMLAVWFAFSPSGMVYNNSVVYFDIDVKTLVISTVICYLVFTGISFLLKRRAPDNRIFDITLYNKGRTVMTKALLDTGNSLKDGFTGKPVIIADKSVVRKLTDYSLYDFFDGNNAVDFKNTDENIRLIPFSTVGKSGMLRAVKIDSITVKNNVSVKNVLLAESESPLGDGTYKVLLNNDILSGRENNDSKIFKILNSKG